MNKKDNMDSPLRLLLIDDNPDDRALTVRELKREFEIQAQEIIDAEGFARALKRGDFDIAITDYQLRWSNGLEILGKIKSRYPDCPVIMFTGTGNEEIAVEAMKHGLDDYVVKSPKHFIRLPAAINAAIKRAKERQTMREIQEALSESEEKYRSLVDSTGDSIYLMDRDCRYLFMNKKHLSRFGLALDKVIGRSYGEFHSKEETTEFAGKVKGVLETGESLSYEYRSERDGGYYIRTLSPVKAADGEIIAVTVDSKDITERKQAEEALIKYEQDKALILDTMSEHVVYRDTKMRVLWANRAAGESVGLAPEQLVGRYCYEIWHQRSKPCVVCPAKETLKTGQQEEMEVTTPDGRIWWIRTYPIRDANGDITKIANVTQEITDRKRAEEAVKESEAQKKAILDASINRIRLVDKDMKIIWANKTTTRELNIAPEDLIGYPCYRIFFDRNTPCDECPSKKALETGQIEHAVVHQPYSKGIEGESYWDNHSVPIKNESGDIVNLIQITRNITKQVLAEKRLKSSQEELRNLADHLQAVREGERTTIAREIHDELGQALTALKMDISWIGKKLPKDQESLLEKARSISTLTDMTIKAVKRISTELRPGLLDDLGLLAAIEWQVEEFQDRTGLTCKFVIDPEDIAVDEKRSTVIFRILQEALTNVARHAQATRVTVSFKEKAHKWVLRIRDNGKGITEKQISDPQSFGLMGMRERVRMWGGEVKIKGVPDKGTTLTVSIPVDE
jgi:PAS domain S-box-containing protein